MHQTRDVLPCDYPVHRAWMLVQDTKLPWVLLHRAPTRWRTTAATVCNMLVKSCAARGSHTINPRTANMRATCYPTVAPPLCGTLTAFDHDHTKDVTQSMSKLMRRPGCCPTRTQAGAPSAAAPTSPCGSAGTVREFALPLSSQGRARAPPPSARAAHRASTLRCHTGSSAAALAERERMRVVLSATSRRFEHRGGACGCVA